MPSDRLHWQDFSVRFRFPIYFTQNIFDSTNKTLVDAVGRFEPNRKHKCIFFIDQGLLKADSDLLQRINNYVETWCKNIELMKPPISLPGGEKIKAGNTYIKEIQNVFFQNNIDRHSYVFAVGGGAFLDAIGFVSAITHRGVRHVRIPTTILSQSDSGVGVKNGLNYFNSKNFVGTFSPPFAVINDFSFIKFLPKRETISGMAEAVKVALIRDNTFFLWIEKAVPKLANRDNLAMQYLIQRCAELHMNQISSGGDPFETGNARPLDFGHWSAHKLEMMTSHELKHGEAVSIGIAIDARYSVLMGSLASGEDERIANLLEGLGFKLWHPSLEKTDADGSLEIINGLNEFREHLGGELTITLLRSCGEGFEANEMNREKIKQAIAWLKSRGRSQCN